MVDLVKIRKKAKRVLGVGGGESEQIPVESVVSPSPATEAVLPATTEPSSTPAHTPHAPLPTPSSPKLERFKETAGQRREGFIEEAVETAAEDRVELLTFTIAGEQYAVAIDHLVEIVTPRTATHVPNADPTIVGIISLRGTMVTVIDVRRKLRHPRAARGNDTRIIVAERGGETLGFEVDRVLRVLKVDAAAIEPHPVVHASELSEAVRGVFRHAGALTILLDLDKLLG